MVDIEHDGFDDVNLTQMQSNVINNAYPFKKNKL